MRVGGREGVIGGLLTESTPNGRETSAKPEGSTWENRYKFNNSAATIGGFANSLESSFVVSRPRCGD